MKQLKIEIPSGANEIIHTLQEKGYEAYLVGGCVRDSILKRSIHDYDITTSATPDETLEIFKDKRIIETGLQHGTITIVVDGEPYEVTTYRIDGNYSDNRRPDKVTFTKSFKEDLKRRDFTINAMAYNDEVGLVDPFNGVEDIKYHKIQCVGKPEDRFAEDALRILRAVRFASQLNFVLEPNTAYVLHKMYRNLESISAERINSEFCKIAASSDFCVQMVLYSDVLSLFIPEIKDMLFYHWLGMNGCLSEELENNKALERFAELVRDYDTWRWSTLGDDGIICKQVNDLLYLYGRDDFVRWCISEIHDEVFPRLYAKDEVVLKIKQDEIDRYIEEKDKTMFANTVCGKVCGFVFSDRYVSELGNRLCKMHPEIDYVAMIDIDGCTVSYRTVKEDIDLGKDVASLFGGGGHPKAAGSKFSQEIKLKVVENIFE